MPAKEKPRVSRGDDFFLDTDGLPFCLEAASQLPPKRCDVVKIAVSLIFLQHQALPATPFPRRDTPIITVKKLFPEFKNFYLLI